VELLVPENTDVYGPSAQDIADSVEWQHGSGAIEFTRFPWPSPADFETLTFDPLTQ